MISIAKHALSISEYLSNELRLSNEDKETLRYGLEVIFESIIKVLILVLVSLWLNIFPQVVVAAITSGGLRSVSGGVHFRSFSHCLVFGTAIAIAISELSLEIAKYMHLELLFVLTSLTFIIGFIAVKKWAPADNNGKPINRLDKRAKYRRLSMIYVLIWCLVMLLMLGFAGKNNLIITISLTSIMSFWFQIFTITPVGYRWIENIDQAINKIIS